MPNYKLEVQAKYDAAVAEVEELRHLLESATDTPDFAFEQNRLKKEALQLRVIMLKAVLEAPDSPAVDDELNALINRYIAQIDKLYLNPSDCSFYVQLQLKKLQEACKVDTLRRAIGLVMQVCRQKILLQETEAELTRQKILRKINSHDNTDTARLERELAKLQAYADVVILVADNEIQIKPFGASRHPAQPMSTAWYAEMLAVADFMALQDRNTIVDTYALQVTSESSAPPAQPPAATGFIGYVGQRLRSIARW